MNFRLIIFLILFLFGKFTSDSKIRVDNPGDISDRFLIITAEDFGASKNIDEGIGIAADKEVITSISVLTNFKGSIPELKVLIQKHPEIEIGAHLNITTGKPVLGASLIPSLVTSNGNFYTLEALFPVLHKISLADLESELRAQIMVLLNNGIKVSYLSDQYGVLTFYGPFYDVLLNLAVEFNLPVRSPVLAGVKYPDEFPHSQMNVFGRQTFTRLALKDPLIAAGLLKYARSHETEKKLVKLDRLGIMHPDFLIEYFWGNPTPSNFIYILEHLPNGTSELILHLGTGTRQEFYPTGLDLSYFRNREYELITVTSDSINNYFDYLNIKKVGYSTLN